MDVRKIVKLNFVKKYGFIYIICLLIIIFSIYLINLELSYGVGGREYLLSAVSQVLGATFALIFSITLVAGELSAKYSPRMVRRAFTKMTIIYMLIFIVGIVFPLVALIDISDIKVKISLILCAICLLFLIPYLVSLIEKLSPKVFLEDLWEKTRKNLSENSNFPEEIEIIDNVIMSSYSFKDYDTFRMGVEKLGLFCIEQDPKRKIKIVSEIFKRISRIGEATIEDPRAPIIVMEVLLNVGKQAFDNKFYVAPIWSVTGIERIGYLAIIKKNMDAPQLAVSFMSDLGMKYSTKQNNSAADRAFNGLINYGELAMENRMEFLVEPISYWSWLLGSSISKYFPNKTDVVTQKLLDFESYLMNFKSSTVNSYYKKGFNRAKISIKNLHPDLKDYIEKIEKCRKEQKI